MKHNKKPGGSPHPLKRFVMYIYDSLFDRPAAFRVLYEDGNRTYRMRKSGALNLQENFGGKLIYDPPEFDA